MSIDLPAHRNPHSPNKVELVRIRTKAFISRHKSYEESGSDNSAKTFCIRGGFSSGPWMLAEVLEIPSGRQKVPGIAVANKIDEFRHTLEI
jgi:hypothetical protein